MMTAAGKLPMKDLVPYILAQVAGGLCAFELSKRINEGLQVADQPYWDDHLGPLPLGLRRFLQAKSK